MYKTKQIGTLLFITLVIALSISLAGQTKASVPTTPKTLDRRLDPVVIPGHTLFFMGGTPLGQIFAYTYTNNSWGNQIPVQVDERSSDGIFVTSEDSLLDENDEVVVMAQDLGDKAPVNGTLPIIFQTSDFMYEIEVSDPLNPNKKGWVYIVSSASLFPTFTDDYVDYNAGTKRITSNQYDLGFASAHSGLDYLALNNSGVDLLDRGKIRIKSDLSKVISQTITENLFNQIIPANIKDGPVRVIVRQSYTAVGSTLNTTYLGYDATIVGIADLELFDLPGVTVTHLRTSMDFNSNAIGSSYYNNNVPSGIPIDGTPDSSANTSLSYWFQMDHSSGKYIQVTEPGPMGANPQFYYEDDSTTGVPDTGDGQSYAESGYFVSGDVNLTPTSRSAAYILSASLPSSGAEGPTYESYFFNPLIVKGKLVPGTIGANSLTTFHFPLATRR